MGHAANAIRTLQDMYHYTTQELIMIDIITAAIAASVQTGSIHWLSADGDPAALESYREALYAECDDHVNDVLGDDGHYDDFWGQLAGQTWRICVSH
jgi:hypothetical protein